MDNKCIVCGKERYSKNTKVLYCSQECRTKDLTRTCPNCNNDFVVSKKSRKQIYCSKKCGTEASKGTEMASNRAKGIVEKVKTNCAFCHEELLLNPSKISKHNFCSKEHYLEYAKRNLKRNKCLNCQKEIPLTYEYSTRRFCSPECNIEYSKDPSKNKHILIVECDNCGKQIKKNISNVKNNEKYFCNRKCYREAFLVGGTRLERNNNDYVTFRSVLDGTSESLKWRKEVLNKFDNKCAFCSKKSGLHVHHIIPAFNLINSLIGKEYTDQNVIKISTNKIFNDVNNGIVLCTKHHNMCHTNSRLDEESSSLPLH